MGSFNKKNIIIGCVVLVIAVVVAAVVIFLPMRPVKQAMAPTLPGANNKLAAVATSTRPVKMAPIPQGSQTYQIMQAPDVMPKIVQATVNPVDVHVGDTQTLTVIISDPNPITSVVATIRTDNGTTTVPLSLVGPAALNDVLPAKYFVNAQNQLALVAPNNGGGNGDGNIAQAAEGDEKYSATWTVKDTHVAKYYTKFTATDAKGSVNSVELGWTDAECVWTSNNYASSTWSLEANYPGVQCAVGSDWTDGPEGGYLAIDNPLGMSIQASGTLVLNPGYSMNFSNGGYIG